MEHPCPKCGATVEDGVPFCKECRAPQIRVVGVEPRSPGGHDDQEFALRSVERPQSQSSRIRWWRALPGAALAGALSLLLAQIPLAAYGPAFLAGGALSVVFYRRRVKEAQVTPAIGARLGAAGGGFGFLLLAMRAILVLFYQPDELRKAVAARVSQLVSQLAARGYSAEDAPKFLEFLKTPEGFVMFSLLVALVISVVGSSIGGAWYSAWLRKRARR